MRIPLRYTLRNLWTRKLTTILTAGGMALVVFVFSAVQMLDTGLRASVFVVKVVGALCSPPSGPV